MSAHGEHCTHVLRYTVSSVSAVSLNTEQVPQKQMYDICIILCLSVLEPGKLMMKLRRRRVNINIKGVAFRMAAIFVNDVRL